ncbi:MAG: hypothetical protein ABEH81_14630, partial [Halopenitus sp.]
MILLRDHHLLTVGLVKMIALSVVWMVIVASDTTQYAQKAPAAEAVASCMVCLVVVASDTTQHAQKAPAAEPV